MGEVVLEKLSKSFGRVQAVSDISLTISDGQFITFLGPSGCGKTTTLRMIAGLEEPTSGRIYIDGKLVNDLPPKDRDVAMVFQAYALYPHMSVWENMEFPLKARKLPRQEIYRRVKETADLLRIGDLLDRKPRELSGGQQQRVALGRALVREPKVFLLDEPLSNLDAKLRMYMRAELKRLIAEIGKTTIYVTHDQIEAMTMSDRIALMNNGSMEQLGAPEDLYERPANTFVASFIGSPPMNLIPCRYQREGDQAFVGNDAFRLNIDFVREKVKDLEGEDLTFGVRPEDIFIHTNDEAAGQIKAFVYVVEPLGSEKIIDLKLGDQLIKARAPMDVILSINQPVSLSFRMSHIHLFDKEGNLLV